MSSAHCVDESGHLWRLATILLTHAGDAITFTLGYFPTINVIRRVEQNWRRP